MTERSTDYTRSLALPDQFAGGQLFAFCGTDEKAGRMHDRCGVLTGEVGEIRFFGSRESSVLLRFAESAHDYDVVLPDLIAADGGAILVTFADAQTVVGRSDTLPAIRSENEEYVSGSRTVSNEEYAFSLAVRATDGGACFALCRRADAETAEADAQAALALDADALADRVLDLYQAFPPCPSPHFEKLWYKCLSVNRADHFCPQDGLTHALTLSTPEIRASDVCFYALATARYAPALARDAVLALLEQQRADGSIPHSLYALDANADAADLPVICATVWSLFEVTGDVELLKKAVQPLQRYLDRMLADRRSPGALMTGRDESGADQALDALDRSVLAACELLSMQRIYLSLADHVSALRTEQMFFDLAARINDRLWDEKTRCYYDRTWSGAFRRTLTSASFLPLYVGVCDPRQAHCLLTHLTPLLDLPFPIPSGADGGVHLLENYFVYIGLQRCGFGRQAAILRQKTLEGADKQFRETGVLFDSYDPHGGKPARVVADCSRSASVIELFLWG